MSRLIPLVKVVITLIISFVPRYAMNSLESSKFPLAGMQLDIQYVLFVLLLVILIPSCQDMPPVPSAGLVKGSGSFQAGCNLLENMGLLSTSDNELLKVLDPKAYGMLETLRTAASTQNPASRAIHTIDPSLFPCHAFHFNCQTPTHTDNKDDPRLWAVVHSFGNYTKGGEFHISTLNLTIPFRPRDTIWLRGNVLEHCIKPWDGGQRISCASFVHKSHFSYYKLPFDF